jgi:hypothetical protein
MLDTVIDGIDRTDVEILQMPERLNPKVKFEMENGVVRIVPRLPIMHAGFPIPGPLTAPCGTRGYLTEIEETPSP